MKGKLKCKLKPIGNNDNVVVTDASADVDSVVYCAADNTAADIDCDAAATDAATFVAATVAEVDVATNAADPATASDMILILMLICW